MATIIDDKRYKLCKGFDCVDYTMNVLLARRITNKTLSVEHFSL